MILSILLIIVIYNNMEKVMTDYLKVINEQTDDCTNNTPYRLKMLGDFLEKITDKK